MFTLWQISQSTMGGENNQSPSPFLILGWLPPAETLGVCESPNDIINHSPLTAAVPSHSPFSWASTSPRLMYRSCRTLPRFIRGITTSLQLVKHTKSEWRRPFKIWPKYHNKRWCWCITYAAISITPVWSDSHRCMTSSKERKSLD